MQHSLYTEIWSPPAAVMHLLKAELQPPPPAVCQRRIELLSLTLSLGLTRYWRCDKTCASAHIGTLVGRERGIRKLTRDI